MNTIKTTYSWIKWLITTALPKTMKTLAVAYVVLSVAWFTATIDGSQHQLKFWTDNAKAMKEITKEPGEMSYQEWRNAKAKHMMETESWNDHMLDKAKDAVDTNVHTKSRTELEKKKEAFNMEVYGQKTVPTQAEYEANKSKYE